MNIPHEQYVALYNRLPRPIRDFLIDEEFGKIMSDLEREYGLHVDTTGALSDIVTQMLMGVLNPVAALDSMKNAGIPLETARKIVTELNQRIFIPLRDKVRKGPEAENEEDSEEQETPVVSPTPVMHIEVPVQPAPAPVAASAPVTPPTPLPIQPQQAPVPVMPAPQSTPIPVRTMAQDMEAVKAGKIPSYNVPEAPVTSAAPLMPAGNWNTTPARSFVTSSIPTTNIPIVAAPVQAVPVPQTPIPAQSPVAPHPPNPPSVPLTKDYSNDPYREPVL